MQFGIRLRFAVWLLAALLPVGIAALYVFGQIEDEVADRVAADLEGVRRLEASRIENALADYRSDGRNLAEGPHVRAFTADVVRARATGQQTSMIAGYDGFSEVDAFRSLPLQELAEALQAKTAATTAEVAALKIVSRSGDVLGETRGFDWEPADPQLLEDALSSGESVVGDAFRDSEGLDRLGVVVPIQAPDDEIVGALLLENQLGPIVDLVVAHEGFGATSEAHIAQPTADGSAAFITLLRFERDAAFTKVVPASTGLPIIQSLDAPEGRVIFSPDYRGEESILAVQTIEETGWGLVVKIDRSEALSPVLGHTDSLKAVALLGVLGVLFGWAAFLDPVARRLRALSEGAERVASGEYHTPLDDRSSDEIGTVGKSIDRLATDLAADIAVRSDIEGRLRHQATHDATTQLYNRQFATTFMNDLAAKTEESNGEEAFSLLFVDLDDFKSINDQYGHGTGDEVLAATAGRLLEIAGENGEVARWGGDEFVVLLPGAGVTEAAAVTTNLVKAFEAPIATVGGAHYIGASVGAATYRAGTTLKNLLQDADEAMFAKKEERRVTRPAVESRNTRMVESAIVGGNVVVLFQPLVADNSAGTVSVEGAEALVRIRRSDGELIAPGEFLRDVERLPAGRDLDRQVVRAALAQQAMWIENGRVPANFQMSVNCSEAFIGDVATPEFIAEQIAGQGLSPHNLMLEISESAPQLQKPIVEALKLIGVRIAVDDLGVHNSNVDRLIDSGATVAKLDQRWIRDAATDTIASSVLRHLVSLCGSLGFDVIAEGVETTDQLERMRTLGVKRFQGYLFATPVTAEEFADRFFAKPLVSAEASATHSDR